MRIANIAENAKHRRNRAHSKVQFWHFLAITAILAILLGWYKSSFFGKIYI
jgi:hypothetical protein